MRKAWEEFKAMTDPLSVWLANNTVSGANTWVAKSALIAAFNKGSEMPDVPGDISSVRTGHETSSSRGR